MPSGPSLTPFVGVPSFVVLNGFVGDTIPGGLLKLNIEELPGPVGVVGSPGDAKE